MMETAEQRRAASERWRAALDSGDRERLDACMHEMVLEVLRLRAVVAGLLVYAEEWPTHRDGWTDPCPHCGTQAHDGGHLDRCSRGTAFARARSILGD